MKGFIKTLSALALASLMLTSCTGGDGGKNEGSTTTENKSSTPAVYDENAAITISYNGNEATGNGSAELPVSTAFTTGKTIKITVPENQHFLAVSISKGNLDEAIVYINNGTFSYKVPDFTRSYPSKLTARSHTISARIPTVAELTASHNLALNPADITTAKSVFPHASTNNVYSTGADANDWMARNIIDGFTQNNGHGQYPYQSWGPGSSMSKTDYIKIDFGHEVTLTELVLFIRADFPHDTYWKSCTLQFSDGSTIELDIDKTAKGQSFELDNVVTTSLKFLNFVKGDTSMEWAAWIELQANGYETVEG